MLTKGTYGFRQAISCLPPTASDLETKTKPDPVLYIYATASAFRSAESSNGASINFKSYCLAYIRA